MQHRNFSPQFYFVTFVTIKMTAKFPASNQSNFSLTCFIFVVMFFFSSKIEILNFRTLLHSFLHATCKHFTKNFSLCLWILLPALGCRVVSHRMGHGDGPQLEKSLSLWAKVGLKSIPFFTIRGFLKNYFALWVLLKNGGFWNGNGVFEVFILFTWICFVLIWKKLS